MDVVYEGGKIVGASVGFEALMLPSLAEWAKFANFS
jgi:hypothetical protein